MNNKKRLSGAAALRMLAALCALAVLCGCAALAEPDDLYADRPVKSTMTILLPKDGTALMERNLLPVEAVGHNVAYIEARAQWEGQEMILSKEGEHFTATLQLPPVASAITVTVSAYDEKGELAAQGQRTLKTPREELIDRMIEQARKDAKTKGKNFLRAEKSADAGMCKNFVMRMFDTYKEAYEMQEFPGVDIFMPLNDSGEHCKPYRYGVQWRPEEASGGNCFEIVHAFRYDGNKTHEENRALALEMLKDVKRGDCFQLVGVCEDFNSPHSLIFISDYDAQNDRLEWTDCNMKGTRVNGERWGWVQYGTKRSSEWMLDTICRARNGATLYRLREDLVKK